MPILKIIEELITCLRYYFELKNKSFAYDILQKSKQRQRELEEELEKIRSDFDADAITRDDIVLRLQEERIFCKHISDTYLKTSSGSQG